MDITCTQCGTVFADSPSRANQKTVFCSRRCFAEYRNKTIKKVCAVCGVDFVVHGHRASAMYCSRQCANISRGKKIRGSQHPNWRGGKSVERVCKQCGKSFYRRTSEIKSKGSGQFCSRACVSVYSNSGSKSHLWKGGVTSDPYPEKWTYRFKLKIRKRDNHKCQLCHQSGKNVHHIDYNKDNLSQSNLITLCSSCHGRTNKNRPYWQRLFENYL